MAAFVDHVGDADIAGERGAEAGLPLVVPEPFAVTGGEVAHLHEGGELLRDVAKALIGLRSERRRRTPIAGAGVVEERAIVPEITEGAAELDGQAVAAGEVHV